MRKHLLRLIALLLLLFPFTSAFSFDDPRELPPLTGKPPIPATAIRIGGKVSTPQKRQHSVLPVITPRLNTLPDEPRSGSAIGPSPRPKPLPIRRPVGPDPIRFTMQANKTSIANGEEFDITITAELLPILPSQLFFLEDQKSFRLKLLLPQGAQQIGGTYYDLIGETLGPDRLTQISFTWRGKLGSSDSLSCFRLLRQAGAATDQSLFIEKGQLCLKRVDSAHQDSVSTVQPNSVDLSKARVGTCPAPTIGWDGNFSDKSLLRTAENEDVNRPDAPATIRVEGCYGSIINWYKGQDGNAGVLVSSGYSTLYVTRSDFVSRNITYRYYATCGCSNGESAPSADYTVTLLRKQIILTSASSTACGATHQYTPLTVQGCPTGATIWFRNSRGFDWTMVSTGSTTRYDAYGGVEEGTYWASCIVKGADGKPGVEGPPSNSVTITSSCATNPCAGASIPSAPSAENKSGCGSVLLTATGCETNGYRWYSTPSGGNSLNSTSIYQPTLSQTTDFYVSCATVCAESGRLKVTATISTSLDRPGTTTDVAKCPNSAFTLTANGCSSTGYRWYTAESGGSSFNYTNAYTTPNLSGTTTYYVSCINDCGESARTPVTATVNTAPQAPYIYQTNQHTITNLSICPNSSVSLSAEGCSNGVRWYQNGNYSSVTSEDNPFISGNLASGATFTARCKDTNGCGDSGNSNSFTATLKYPPGAPYIHRNNEYNSTSQSICQYNNVSLWAENCSNGVKWYQNGNYSTTIGEGNPFNSGNLASGATFTARCQDTNGCGESENSNLFTVSVKAIPSATPWVLAAPNAFTTNSSYTVCEGTQLMFGIDRTPSQWPGYSLQWMAPNNSTGPLNNNWEINPVTAAQGGTYTYTVTDPQGCYNSVQVPITVTPANYRSDVNVVNCTELIGWLVNQACEEQINQVRILIDGQLVATVPMSEHRTDVRQLIMGRSSGFDQYGFKWTLPSQYKRGLHAVTITDLKGTPLANGLNRSIGVPPPTPWVLAAPNAFTTNSSYTVCEGTQLMFGIDRTPSQWPGYSLQWMAPNNSTGPLNNNWEINPVTAAQGGTYTYTVTDPQGCYNLVQVPITVTPANYRSDVNVVNCTELIGWLVNQACEEQINQVRILIDGQLVATVPMSEHRTDVRQLIMGRSSGFDQYGFKWTLPSQYKRGLHAVTITDLKGTPLANGLNRSIGVPPPTPWVLAAPNAFTTNSSYTVCEGTQLMFGIDRTPSQWPGYSLQWMAPNNSTGPLNNNWEINPVTAAQGGTYTYTVTDPQGCYNSVQVPITVTPANYRSDVNVVNCTELIGWLVNQACEEQINQVRILIDGQLVATVPMSEHRTDVRQLIMGRSSGFDQYGFKWTLPSQYKRGLHAVTITDLKGTPLANGLNRSIGVPPPTPWVLAAPNAFTTNSSYTVCEGTQLMFGIDRTPSQWPGYSLQWMAPNNSTGPLNNNWEINPVTAAQGGTYTYTVTDPQGCYNSVQVPITVTPANYRSDVNVVNCTELIGWLVNQACEEQINQVRILIDGQLVATVPMSEHRTDVRQLIMGRSSGFDQYGFKWTLPSQYKRGLHAVTITDLKGTPLANGLNRSIGVPPPTPWVLAAPNAFTTNSSYTVCEGTQLMFGIDRTPSQWPGYSLQWMAPNNSTGPLNNNWEINPVTAAQGGTYTYTVTDPQGCYNSVQVPITVTPANYRSDVNVVNCTELIGWLVNQACEEQINQVRILIDGQLVATVPMSEHRTDVRQLIMGRSSGFDQYGFKWTLPSQYKRGLHAVTITDLKGTPLANGLNRSIGVPPPTPWVLAAPNAFTTNSSYTVCEGTQLMFGIDRTPSQWPGYSLQWMAPNNSTGPLNNNWEINPVTAAQGGTYTYTVTDPQGCYNSVQVIVTVVTVGSMPPTLTARVAGVSTTQSLTLTASGCPIGSTVLWSGPNSTTATGSIWTIASFTQTSPYTARCETTGGCASSASIIVPYAVPSSPIIRTTATQLCAGQSLTLTASGCQTGTTVLWSNGQTGEVLILTPAVTATYKATCMIGEVMSDPSTQLGVTVLSSHTVTISGSQTFAVGETISLSSVSSASGTVTYRWIGPNNFTSTAQNPTIPSATTAMSGIYTVVATTPGGCTATAQTSVSLSGAAPSATISGNLTICAGQSTTLTASGGSSYRWSTGEPSATLIVNPTTTSIYSVTVTSLDGATATAAASVTVLAMPSLSITGKSTLCAGESTTLTVSGGTAYLWSTGELGDQIVVSPTVSTTYSVWSSADNGCLATAEMSVSPTSFSVATSSHVGGVNSGNQVPSVQAPAATYGQTFTLSATIESGQPQTVTYSWSGPNSFTSNQQFPSFLYTSEAQLGTYEVVASTEQGCVSGGRVGFGTEPGCALSVSVLDKTNSFSVTTDEHWLTAAGCPTGSSVSWSNGTEGRVGPDGKITWADGETGQLAGGLTGDRVIVVNPQRTTTYIAICALPTSKTCTHSVEIKVASPDCANLQITASATTYVQGDNITLTAANCAGTLIWSNGLGSANRITIAPTADLIVSAECTDGGKTCYSNAIAIRNQSCIQSLYVNTILTLGDGKKQVQLGYQGCETGTVSWSVVSGSGSRTTVQKQSETLAGLYTVVGVTGNLTVAASCTRPGGATCTAATLTVTENALNTCKGYFIGVGTSVGAPPNTVTIDGVSRAFTLVDETNAAFNTTPQQQVYVPVSTKEKLY